MVAGTTDRQKVLTSFRRSPAGFATRVLGVTPRLHQVRILNSIRDRRRTLAISCNSIGKDFIAGVATHWWLQIWEESLVITTAPTGEQVKNIQWKEIRHRFETALIPLGGTMPEVEPVYRISTRRGAIGIATREEAERLQGHHEAHILIIITEGSAVSDEVFSGIRALMASGDVRLLVLSNPTRNIGEVYEITQGNRAGWNVIQVDGWDLPNLKACKLKGEEHLTLSAEELEERDECPNPTPYLLTHHFEAECREDFGEESDYYKIHVRGLHGLSGSDQLIPRDWLDAAFERVPVPSGKKGGGLDIAKSGGKDFNAYAEFDGNLLRRLVEWHPEGPNATEERVKNDMLRENEKLPMGIDDTGLGGGIVERLHGYPRVFGIDFSTKAEDSATFANKPTEMYFEVRRRLDPDGDNPLSFTNVPPPLRKKFTKQMLRPRFMTEDTKGRLRVDKRGGGSESPDMFDAVALALEAQGRFLWSGLKIHTGNLDLKDPDERKKAAVFAGIRNQSF